VNITSGLKTKIVANVFFRNVLFAAGLSLIPITDFSMSAHPSDTTKKSNALIHESSPYLRQHAYNPVNWVSWSTEAFSKAVAEDKLVLISIGYSSCHWCHVMEKESFEDDSVAKLMNDHFVCIKVDREERPDVDDIYMTAVQLMTGQGGWPLNCFALPDGRPVFGGTYFPKGNWMNILNQLHESYVSDKRKFTEYAEQLTNGVANSEVIDVPIELAEFDAERLDEMVINWQRSFDLIHGGPNRAPKFPMPNNYEFLMAYAHLNGDTATMNHVDLSLRKMAMGGIYDQIGGGFSRYSTDTLWKVPHFEKMLYDNAQLVSLYSKAFQRTGDNLYREVVFETIAWLKREMMSPEGSFYSALDADSEGEEGKFYVWNEADLKKALGRKYDFAKSYYGIGPLTEWEGNHILMQASDDVKYAQLNNISASQLEELKSYISEKLMSVRDKRIRPGLDDKSLTAWNAMMIVGLCDAYDAFGDQEFLSSAIGTANWITQKQIGADGILKHTFKDNESKIDGFLDDYAFTIEAFVRLYEVTFDEVWLTKAKLLSDVAIRYFLEPKSNMFYYTSSSGEQLIARKMEIADNVIPSSNSCLARVLYKLGILLENKTYKSISEQMLANVYDGMEQNGSAYSNWGLLALMMNETYYEVAITGTDCKKKRNELAKAYLPNAILMGGTQSELPFLRGKFLDETTIFICVENMCKKPTGDVSEALGQMAVR